MKSFLKSRLEKEQKLRDLKIDPYPETAKRTHSLKKVEKDFNALEGQEVFLCGRIILIRSIGKCSFINIEDQSGVFQLFFNKKVLGDNKYGLLKLLDLGDFIQASGKLFKTRTKEKTLDVKDFKILTKSLRPLPDKFHGLKDSEVKYRKRYLDLATSRESRDYFIKRSELIKNIRHYFEDKQFIEVETPSLEHVPGGAEAEPFITHHNTLDIDLYLRISLELHLKRLIVGGYEQIFEIGKVFRNEGMSTEHLQEFTELEFYWAYANLSDLESFVEKLFSSVIKKTFGTLHFKYKGKELDFTTPWPRYDYTESVKKYSGIDLDKYQDFNSLKKAIQKNNIELEIDKSITGLGRLIDILYKNTTRPHMTGPCFLVNHPLPLSPLAKKNPDNPAKTLRLQILIASSEAGNGFSELNDPIDQKNRFEEQLKMREKGDKEAYMMDSDFIEALEYGLPPTAGFGMGIDRLFAILTNSESIRDTVLFPTMKPKSE